MKKSIHNKNNWDEVRKIRAEFTKSDVDNYPYYAGLNEMWDRVRAWDYPTSLENGDSRNIARDGDERIAETPLAGLRYFIDVGVYPPPELLVWLDEAFRHYYFSNVGDHSVELEEVFFGKRKPKIGNHAKRALTTAHFKAFRFEIALERGAAKHQNRKPVSLEQLAENYFQGKLAMLENESSDNISKEATPDIDNFLRAFRRWNKADK